MTALNVPLTIRQVEAANSIREHLPTWLAMDEALADVEKRFPERDPTSVLVKAAVLDRLYNTSVLSLSPAVAHFTAVFQDADFVANASPIDLVERLAIADRNRTVFAAKFCHFFVDPTRFPILDSFAEKTVALHLGRNRHQLGARRYRAFFLKVRRLKEQAGLECSYAELDRYLYLAEQYKVWKRNHAALINREAARLFASEAPEVAALLAVMDGTAKAARQ